MPDQTTSPDASAAPLTTGVDRAEPGDETAPDLDPTTTPSDPMPSKARFGGLTPAEASARALKAKRERKEAREREASLGRLSFRQRLGLSLAKLEQHELDALVRRLAKEAAQPKGNSAAQTLVRLAVDAYGPSSPDDGESASATQSQLEAMSPRERQALMARELERMRDDTQPARDESDPREENRRS